MAISAKMVQELRARTNVGMMDCKRALEEADGVMDKAVELLRKRGIAKAESRAGRQAKEGAIASYIHAGSQLGVLLEINSETDFVARTDEFQTFSKDVAMHIAAAAPLVVNREDVDAEMLKREKNIYRDQALSEGKPEHIVDRIVEGRMEKYYQEVVLMEQAFVKDPDKTIQDLHSDLAAKCGENITIRRFARFVLGEES
ncbi:MAG: translation elongation factor Ts [Gemmatimonadetes bacterium]|nr:translation elongation factor Ts [Gemmatimonadota bacterium]MYK51842.1 translation elongation factor Ts [Gemmatimonadota bacterium]